MVASLVGNWVLISYPDVPEARGKLNPSSKAFILNGYVEVLQVLNLYPKPFGALWSICPQEAVVSELSDSQPSDPKAVSGF